MNLRGFIGGSYNLDSVNVDCQRSVNLYPEIIESGNGKEGAMAYLRSVPGLKDVFNSGTQKCRLIYCDDNNIPGLRVPNTIVVSGSEVYLVRKDLGTGVWNKTKLGDLETSTGSVYAASFQQSVSTTIGGVPTDVLVTSTVLVDGVNCYYFTPLLDGTLGGFFGNFAMFGFPPVLGASQVVFIDGYLIFSVPSENKFYVSEWQSLVVNALDFASSEGSIDVINGILARQRELWVFNEKSVEVFINTGNASFPFERTGGGFTEYGNLAPDSPKVIDNTILWLGRTKEGQGVVYAAKGILPEKVSTAAIEQAISSYANPEKATSFVYSKNGHNFYVLNFDENSWAYDLKTGLWHERCSLVEGDLVRSKAECCAFLSYAKTTLVGDVNNGLIYELDDNHYTDGYDPLVRMRTFPHLSVSQKRLFYTLLQIDMEVGVGTEVGQGSDPKIMMSFSNDSGHTWLGEDWVSIGRKIGGIGEYKKRVMWTRLGSARDRVFQIKVSDPVKVVLINAEIEFTQGAS